VIVGAGTDNTMSTGSIRGATSSADTSALVHPTDGQMLAVEVETPGRTKYVLMPGCFGVYLTQVGGANGDDGSVSGTASFPTFTYNVFADAAKTILLAGTLTVEAHRPLQIPVHAAEHGLFQWNGATGRLLTVFDEYYDRDACP
jgi:hypothetical protein